MEDFYVKFHATFQAKFRVTRNQSQKLRLI